MLRSSPAATVAASMLLATALVAQGGTVPDPTWARIAPRSVSPRAVDRATLAYDFLGGGGRPLTFVERQTWGFDGTDWQILTTGVGPNAQYGHVLATDPLRGRIVLFGGSDDQRNLLDETWEWDGSTWTRIGAAGASAPPARVGATFAFDRVSQRLVLFGGQGANRQLLDDTWSFDGTAWRQELPLSSPPPRSNHHSVDDGIGVLLFGGILDGPAVSARTWRWNGTAWVELTVATAAPPARAAGAMTFDPVRARVVLHGGQEVQAVPGLPNVTTSRVRNDTWEFDPVSTIWSRVRTRGQVQADVTAAAVYDVGRSRTMLVTSGLGPTVTWDYEYPQSGDAQSFSVATNCGLFSGASLEIAAGTRPRLGTTFEFVVRNAPDGPVFLAIGASDRTANPQLLEPFGFAAGCAAWISLDTGVFGTASGSRFALDVTVPNDPTLTGVEFFTQAFLYGTSRPGLPLPLFGATVTNASGAVIGR